MRTSSTVYTCKIAFCSSIIGFKIVILHGIDYFYTSIESQVSPLKDGMLHIKICLAVLKLYRVEQHEIGQNLAKKRDANFIVYLMFNLSRFRNSWTDLYRRHMVQKRRFLAFH